MSGCPTPSAPWVLPTVLGSTVIMAGWIMHLRALASERQNVTPLIGLAVAALRIARHAEAMHETPRRDEELDGYAKGYADGLARRPMEAEVIPIQGRR